MEGVVVYRDSTNAAASRPSAAVLAWALALSSPALLVVPASAAVPAVAVAAAPHGAGGHVPRDAVAAVPHGAGGVTPGDAAAPGGQPGTGAVRRPVAVAPVPGPVVRAFVQPDGPYGRGHRGVDLAAGASQVVRAAMAGTVRFAGAVAGETWITVAHGDGLETTYGGVDPDVMAGDRVVIGQRLGRMRPGRRALDWGARAGGAYIDPLGLLTGWRVRLVPPHDR